MYLSITFLAVAAIQHFGFQSLSTSQHLRFAQAGGVLMLVTLPAFLMRMPPLLFVAVYFDVWMLSWYTLTHQIDRFLDPATPALALLAGVGYASITGRGSRRIAKAMLGVALAYALATTLLIHGVLLGGLYLPRDEFLCKINERSTYCHPAILALNANVGADGKVLFLGEARTFYCEVPVVASTVFDRGPLERALEAADPADPSPDVRKALCDEAFTHIYFCRPEFKRLNDSYAYRLYGERVPGMSRYNVEALLADMVARGYLRAVQWFPHVDVKRQPFVIYEIRRP
ncbi:hypothetical protein HQ560_14090 [bacterium]|nr:hypothetical protein [bacterium]